MSRPGNGVNQMNIQEFITKNNIKMTVKPRLANPLMDGVGMDHWTVTIKGNNKRMSVAYSMGSGHKGKEPDLEGVLECLASDVSCSQDTFSEFCSNLGYDEDSRKAEKIYLACKAIKGKLAKVLPVDELLEVDF